MWILRSEKKNSGDFVNRPFLCLLAAATSMVQANAVQQTNSDYSCCETKRCCNPSCYFKPCSEASEILITGDFLYWKGALRGLEGAFGKTSIVISGQNQITTTTLTETDQEPHFKWRPGFRVGATYLLDCFDTDLNWTHFHGYGKHSNDNQNGRWKIKYDTLDLLFGYKFYPCDRFLIKPFIGLRGAKIHQTLHSHLETIKIEPLSVLTAITNLNDREKFWGLAPQIGLEADLYLGFDLSLYVTVDAVNYFGHVNSKNIDTDTFASLAAVNVSAWRKKHNFDSFGMDDSIGIRWDKFFCDCCYSMHLMLKLGLEQHRIYDFSDLGSDGSLSLDGAFAEAGFGYLF